MQKQSDTSLRRHQLPTIAGSPSVGTVGHTSSKEGPPLSSNNASLALSKETPTKIPRIASRSSTVTSPTLKSRRTSLHVSETTPSSESPTASHEFFNEFGILETPSTNTKLSSSRHSVRASPSTTGSVSRVPRQSTTLHPLTWWRRSLGRQTGNPCHWPVSGRRRRVLSHRLTCLPKRVHPITDFRPCRPRRVSNFCPQRSHSPRPGSPVLRLRSLIDTQ
jgi:hypothetical protein